MSTHKLDADASAGLSSYLRFIVLAAYFLLLSLCAVANSQSSDAPRQAYIPPELRVADRDIKALLDSAEKFARLGNYGENLVFLQKALELATERKSVGDRGIVEDKIAVYYFTQGKLEDAKSQFLNSLSDGVAVTNLVLQADVLVALSALQQVSGHLDQAMKTVNQALNVSRESKSLYIESRVLGELSRLQLLAGKPTDARNSIEEALQIDRFNRYDWEPNHLLYLANLNVAESKTDKAIEIGTSARDLAVKSENYLVFIQASLFLGQGYVQTGRADEGIRMIELSRKGVSGQSKPLFQFPDVYNRTASLPYLKITFLEALARAYETANRPDDALSNWQDMYKTATASGFAVARVESARKLADLYKEKKELSRSIDFYALAAEASLTAGNDQSRIEALTSEVGLLLQQGQRDKGLKVEDELLPLAKASKNVGLQFFVDLVIAGLLDGTEQLDRVESALNDADSLVRSNGKIAGVEATNLVELYSRMADLYERRHAIQQELVALEKGITPAMALANAPSKSKDIGPLSRIMQRLQSTIPESHIQELAETSEADGRLGDALIFFEILQYFDEVDAAWRGKYEDYKKTLNNNANLVKLLQIPPKIISQDSGAIVLAKNIEEMGPVANRVEPLGLGLLTMYYMSHQRPDMAVQFARQGLLSLSRFEGSDTPSMWSVAMSCELATALLLQKDLKSAVDVVNQCMSGARKLGIPQLLRVANQTNIWVLDAAGKHDEAQESIQFLAKQTPDDPFEYVQLALIDDQRGDWPAAADAWRKAVVLYEAQKDLKGAADAHLALASSPTFGPDAEEKRVHLEAANKLYVQLGSSEGRVKTEAALGTYYAARKNESQSQQYFEGALGIARNAKRKDLEALVLSQVGQADEISGDLSAAVEYYGKSADLYQQQNELANEALQLKSEANVLDSSHKPDEALQMIMKARGIADRSNNWPAKYWVRRTIAIIYGNQGLYQDGVNALREAKQISDDANQPLTSAWAALILASALETIGDWEEASQQINYALPILERFNDTDDEFLAYTELMAIFGARESELKDLSKALGFYQKAYEVIAKRSPQRAAALDLDLTEIYWDQGRFRDAVQKAKEALDYYKSLKDELGQASALISLAEAQRSNGDLQDAANSLREAEPLVNRGKNFYTLGRFYYGKAGLYRAQGKLNEAIEQYERVIAMLEQFKSSSDTKNRRSVAEHYEFIYDELIDAYYSLAQSDKQHASLSANKALEYAELNKARVFATSWGHAFLDGLKHQIPLDLQDTESRIDKEHEALQTELQQTMMGDGQQSTSKVKEKLAKLEIAEAQLQRELRQKSPAYAEVRYPQRMNIQEIPLHPGELLVQLKVLNQATLVWLLSGTEKGTALSAFYKVDRPRQWFADRVFRIRDAFNGGHPEQFDSKITDELLAALFPDSALQSVKAAKAIIFVPDDILFLLPFEMLSSHGQYLLLGTPTEYFPSSAALRLARTSIHATGDWQELFIGIADPITSSADPRYQAVSLVSDPGPQTGPGQPNGATSLDRIVSRGFSLERLPGTADEVHGIASLFASTPSKAETRTGMDATKQELLRTDLARYKFVHFATHGILPVESGIKEPSLVLSYDGRSKDDMLLTLSEILELKLRADMVVLSACNTGSGKVTRAEGVASLGSAFLAAGAASVTVSLWHVADNSTAELMEEFYRNLVKGMSKAAALAAARSALVAKGYDNPFFWAPFVLTGE
jgi:CHAT domain-containing protein